jgi:hypothetical protein
MVATIMDFATKTKSVLVDTKFTVDSVLNDVDTPVTVHIRVLELNYGPVLYFQAKSSIPMYDRARDRWDDHPFQCSKKWLELEGNVVANIIDDTPAIRAMIQELVSTEKPVLYCGTEAGHKARLINAIAMFWS